MTPFGGTLHCVVIKSKHNGPPRYGRTLYNHRTRRLSNQSSFGFRQSLAQRLRLHVGVPPRRGLRRVIRRGAVGLLRDAPDLGDLVTVQVLHVPRRVTPPQLSAWDERSGFHSRSGLERRVLLDVGSGLEHGPRADQDVVLDDGGGDGAVGADGDVLTDARCSPVGTRRKGGVGEVSD